MKSMRSWSQWLLPQLLTSTKIFQYCKTNQGRNMHVYVCLPEKCLVLADISVMIRCTRKSARWCKDSFFSEYHHRLHANHFHWVVIRERELWMSKTGEIQSHPFPFSGNLPMYRIANSSLCIQCTPNSAVLCIVVSLSEIPGSIVRKGRHWE